MLTLFLKHLQQLTTWFDNGSLKLPDDFIDSRFVLAGGDSEIELAEATRQLHEAFARMKSRRTRGKIVFEMSNVHQ